MATHPLDPRTEYEVWRAARQCPCRRVLDTEADAQALGAPARAWENPRPRGLPRRQREGRPVTGKKLDPLFDAAVRLLDAVEDELFTTAQDMAEQGTSQTTLGTVVAALVQRVGQRARREGADEELVAALTHTVWIAAEGMANRALAATAGND
jgi:hypothetical protein